MRSPSARCDGAAIDGDFTRQHPQQRRLAAAVGAEDAQTHAGRQRQTEPLDERPRVEALGDLLRNQQPLGPAVGGIELDAHRSCGRPPGDRRQLILQLRRAVYPRPRLPRARLRAVLQPLDFAPHPVRQGLLILLLPPQRLVLLLQEVAVVSARIQDARRIAAVQLDDPVGDVLEEVAIVADDQERQGFRAQQLLQPQDALDVEMIGGLVHQQQVGRAHQSAGDRQALRPAARQRGGRLLRVGKADLGERDAHPRVPIVGIE